jgi:hypothetical protein
VNNPYAAPSSSLDSGPARPLSVWLVLPIAAIATLPSIYLASLYTQFIRAALYVGHWPYSGQPDPSTMPVDFHPRSKPLEFLLPAAVFITVTCLTALLLMRFARGRARPWLALLTVPALWALCFGLFILDPLGAFEWIMD